MNGFVTRAKCNCFKRTLVCTCQVSFLAIVRKVLFLWALCLCLFKKKIVGSKIGVKCLCRRKILGLRRERSKINLPPPITYQLPYCFTMDILKEFLESSTIHGLAHISMAKVSYILFFFTIFLFSEQISKDFMVWNSLSWVPWSWDPDW